MASEWRNIAGLLESLNLEQAVKTLNLPEDNKYLRANLSSHKREITKLLRSLADGLDEFCDNNECIYINGV